jgi:acyl-CoA reductase-like NAD-dependent aldehyde dehydrogenase
MHGKRSSEGGHVKVRNPRTGELDYEIAPMSADAVAQTARDLRERQAPWAALAPSNARRCCSSGPRRSTPITARSSRR